MAFPPPCLLRWCGNGTWKLSIRMRAGWILSSSFVWDVSMFLSSSKRFAGVVLLILTCAIFKGRERGLWVDKCVNCCCPRLGCSSMRSAGERGSRSRYGESDTVIRCSPRDTGAATPTGPGPGADIPPGGDAERRWNSPLPIQVYKINAHAFETPNFMLEVKLQILADVRCTHETAKLHW